MFVRIRVSTYVLNIYSVASYVCTNMYIYVHTYMDTYICTNMYIYIHTYICTNMYIYIYMHMYVPTVSYLLLVTV